MSAELNIMDDRLIGRYFQAAALGYVFSSLPANLQSKILEALTKRSVALSTSEIEGLINTISNSLAEICKIKEFSISLYTAGNERDGSILSELSPSNPLKGKKSNELHCDWLISISQDVISNSNKYVKIPMILRHYVFSKYRDAGEVSKARINALSTYIAVAGAFISIVAHIERGGSVYELYVVPEASIESIRGSGRLYTLLHLKALNRTLKDTIINIIGNESLSYELSVLLAIAIHVYNAAILTAKMPSLVGLYDLFERFRLISIVPGRRPRRRPMIAWERPLTLTHLYRELEERRAIGILSALHDCIRNSTKYAERVERIQEVTAQCVTSLFAHVETGSLDPLLLCVSGAQRIVDKFRELGISSAERDFVALIKEVSRLAR
jgi:hypothetical protein